MMDAVRAMLESSGFRFALLSGFSFVLNLGLTIFLTEVVGMPAEAAFAVTLAVLLIVNFLVMRYLVYRGNKVSLWAQFLGFLASTAVFRLLEYLAFLGLHTWANLDYKAVIVGILAVSSISKYIYYKKAIFGRAPGRVAAIQPDV